MLDYVGQGLPISSYHLAMPHLGAAGKGLFAIPGTAGTGGLGVRKALTLLNPYSKLSIKRSKLQISVWFKRSQVIHIFA